MVTMVIDGVVTGRNRNATGNISNTRPVTIAGKGNCDQVEVTCDYFSGDIDHVRIETSWPHHADSPGPGTRGCSVPAASPRWTERRRDVQTDQAEALGPPQRRTPPSRPTARNWAVTPARGGGTAVGQGTAAVEGRERCEW
jgi:hypothetical protein